MEADTVRPLTGAGNSSSSGCSARLVASFAVVAWSSPRSLLFVFFCCSGDASYGGASGGYSAQGGAGGSAQDAFYNAYAQQYASVS
jgi:hypothetical protein